MDTALLVTTYFLAINHPAVIALLAITLAYTTYTVMSYIKNADADPKVRVRMQSRILSLLYICTAFVTIWCVINLLMTTLQDGITVGAQNASALCTNYWKGSPCVAVDGVEDTSEYPTTRERIPTRPTIDTNIVPVPIEQNTTQGGQPVETVPVERVDYRNTEPHMEPGFTMNNGDSVTGVTPTSAPAPTGPVSAVVGFIGDIADAIIDGIGVVGNTLTKIGDSIKDTLGFDTTKGESDYGPGESGAGDSSFPGSMDMGGNNMTEGERDYGPGEGGSGNSGSGCFIAGTKIRMSDGTEKDIAQIHIRDVVMTSGGPQKVMVVYHIPYKGLLYAFNGSNNYFVTPSHPFMTAEGWKSIDPATTKRESPDLVVGALKVGDSVLREDGSVQTITALDSIATNTTVYYFDVNGTHDYYADEYWVHNVATAYADELEGPFVNVK